jgi:hypothetical protein
MWGSHSCPYEDYKTVVILDIIHHSAFYLKHGVSDITSVPVFMWNTLSQTQQSYSLSPNTSSNNNNTK